MNWRGYTARVQFYYEQGSISLAQFKQALYASAALKIIFEWSVMTAVLATPFVFLVMLIWGYLWIRHGWYKQLTEVPTIEAVAPINMWTWYIWVRLCKKLDIPIDADDLTVMPPELSRVMSSFHKR